MIHALTDPQASGTITVTITPPSPPAPLVLGWWHDTPYPDTHAAYYLRTVGHAPGIVHFYVSLARPMPEMVARLEEIAQAGAIPLLTLELDDPSMRPGPQPLYATKTFEDATHDAALLPLLQAIGTWKKKLLLRVLHEFNYQDSGYAWALGVGGNDGWSHKAAFRRLAGLARTHCPNAQLVWCAGVSIPPRNSWEWEAVYPGDDVVDVLGIDGYNMGPAGNPGGAWWGFDQAVHASYSRMALLSPRKPVVLCETGCHSAGGDRVAWITGMLAAAKTMRNLRGIVWFDRQLGAGLDCLLESDPASLNAFRAVAMDPYTQGKWIW